MMVDEAVHSSTMLRRNLCQDQHIRKQSLARHTNAHTHSRTQRRQGNWTQYFPYRKLRTCNWIMMNRTNLKCKHLICLKVACNLFPIDLFRYFHHKSFYSCTAHTHTPHTTLESALTHEIYKLN